jgi:CHAT domain-containing protein
VLPVTGDAARQLLVDRHDVAYLPTAMTLLNDAASPVRAPSVLAMAPARSRLRFAPEEARMVGQLFEPRAEVSLGAAATEGRFKREAGRFEVIHLATHGTFNRKNPLLSGVELEADEDDDGLLQVHEVLGLRLSADLVTLSACETGLGSGYLADIPVGDAFVGMTRAFLATGSSAVLATLWEVDDQSSVQFMRRFYKDLVGSDRGRDKAAALASAQRELRRIPALKHPYYWAPFVLVGQAGATKEMGRELAGGPKNEIF